MTDTSEAYDQLRQHAEAILEENGGKIDDSNTDFVEALHELEVHQVELELQNEELRRTAGELEALRDEYFELFNAAPVGFVTLDRKGKIERANESALSILHRSRHYLLGQGFSLLVDPEDLSRYFAAMRKVADSRPKRAKELMELRLTAKDGAIIYVHLEIGAGFDEQGRFNQWRLGMVDITAQKEMGKALRRAHDGLEVRVLERTAELQAKNEELEAFNKKLNGEIAKRKKVEGDLKAQGEKVLLAYEQRDYLSRRLVDLLEKERHEIGSSLHNDIGQMLAGIAMQLEGLKRIRPQQWKALADRVEAIQGLLRELMTRAKGISHNLRSEVLERFGLVPSVRNLVEEMEKQCPLKIHVFIKDVPEDLKDDGKDLAIYRVVQEALTNIVKHAEAKEVFINLAGRDGWVFLTIEDDGVGFDYDMLSTEEETFHSTLGITIMRERTSMVGGTFRIESTPGKGTCIVTEIPIG